MKCRIARHTAALQPVIEFYRDILGLAVLGEFRDHSGYDGVFLGLKGLDWHLEFTVSDEPPHHSPDDDDLLVFYPDSPAEYERLKEQFRMHKVPEVAARNPYWAEHGTTYADPDGFRIVLSVARSLSPIYRAEKF